MRNTEDAIRAQANDPRTVDFKITKTSVGDRIEANRNDGSVVYCGIVKNAQKLLDLLWKGRS